MKLVLDGKWRALIYPFVLDLWIAGVLVAFFLLRVIDSNTGRQLLKLLRTR
jgi:hypothetical protein